MAREPKYGVTINGWERLLVAFAANAGDFPHLEEYRVQLERALDQLREAAAQQAALRAGRSALVRHGEAFRSREARASVTSPPFGSPEEIGCRRR